MKIILILVISVIILISIILILLLSFSSNKNLKQSSKNNDDEQYDKIFPHLTTIDDDLEFDKEIDDMIFMDMLDED